MPSGVVASTPSLTMKASKGEPVTMLWLTMRWFQPCTWPWSSKPISARCTVKGR